MNKMPATLGYWKLRGLAQHIKFFLEYTGTEYNDKIYEHGPAPDFDGSQWTNEKYTLGLDFPNLPYYIDGERKITQSNAIMRYIARKHDLDIKTEDEMIRLEMLENEAVDLRLGFARMCSNPDFEKMKADYISETMSIKIDQFSKFLGNPNWFLGEKVTFIDFFVYELLDCFRILEPSCLDKHDNLKKFMDRLESLEPIKKYMSSSRFIKAPLNGPMAYFGGK